MKFEGEVSDLDKRGTKEWKRGGKWREEETEGTGEREREKAREEVKEKEWERENILDLLRRACTKRQGNVEC